MGRVGATRPSASDRAIDPGSHEHFYRKKLSFLNVKIQAIAEETGYDRPGRATGDRRGAGIPRPPGKSSPDSSKCRSRGMTGRVPGLPGWDPGVPGGARIGVIDRSPARRVAHSAPWPLVRLRAAARRMRTPRGSSPVPPARVAEDNGPWEGRDLSGWRPGSLDASQDVLFGAEPMRTAGWTLNIFGNLRFGYPFRSRRARIERPTWPSAAWPQMELSRAT